MINQRMRVPLGHNAFTKIPNLADKTSMLIGILQFLMNDKLDE